MKLDEKWRTSRNPDVGVPSYLISVKWLERYKKYIHYHDMKNKLKPRQEPDHCKRYHPGQIENSDFLETDAALFLQGTGTKKDYESDWIDRYIKATAAENVDYEVVSGEMYEFL